MLISGVNAYLGNSIQPKTYAKSNGTFAEQLNAAKITDTFTMSKTAKNETVTSNDSSIITGFEKKLAEVLETGKNVDYTGMTPIEVYGEIENRYIKAFGDDFHAAKTFGCCEEYMKMNNQFIEEIDQISKSIHRDLTIDEKNVARGYGGMSYDEIESAIRKKYEGKTEVSDQLNLTGELFQAGILHNKYGQEKACDLRHDIEIGFIDSYHTFDNKNGGYYSKDEFLSKIKSGGGKTIFDGLMSSDAIPDNFKEMYEEMINNLLFNDEGI